LLKLATYNDWEVEQLYVGTAFLKADIEEKIYMRHTKGFRQTDIDGEERVCWFKRSLYGLKQASKNRNKIITTWLEEYGFNQFTVDPGIYVFNKEGELDVLELYVDDHNIVGSAGSLIVYFKSAFGARFNVQDVGRVSWLLDMAVERDRSNRIIRTRMQQYVLDMLERFNIVDNKRVGSPIAVDALSNCVKTSTSRMPPCLVPHQRWIDSLLYAPVSTRPNITMDVSHLSRYMSDPSQSYWEQAKRVLRYLKGTVDTALMYGGTPLSKLVVWLDSYYASDIGERRSRTGYVFMLNGAAVSWKSERQQTVALSTTEAKYGA
jgi:hypothetical protein